MLLTRQQCAQKLNVSTRTVDRECNRGNLRCIRVGRSVRFSPKDVNAYLKNRESSNPAGSDSADCHIGEPEGQDDSQEISPFQFARFLMGHGYTAPGQCEDLLKSFCDVFQVDHVRAEVEFFRGWPKVKHPDYGRDGLDVAIAEAKHDQVSLSIQPPSHVELYELIASIAYHLSQYNKGQPFLLPQRTLAERLGLKDPHTISDITIWLKEAEFIKCVDESWVHGGKKGTAKKYILGINPLRRRSHPDAKIVTPPRDL